MSNINIAYAADNNFAQHLAVSIASLIKNHHDINSNLCIYILDGGISIENRKKIQQLEALNKTTKLIFIYIEPNSFGGFNVFNERYPISIYYRLSLPYLLPDTNRIIYLDCDTVVTSDIKELWDIGMNDFPLLAVEEPISLNLSRLPSLGLNENSAYFNSGVLVLDLTWMRTHKCNEKFQEIADKFHHQLRYPDQDILNIYFQKSWKPIAPKFNAFFFVLQKKYINNYKSYSPILIKEAMNYPIIIHFNQTPKPWEYGCIDLRKKLYFQYLTYTDFSDKQFTIINNTKLFIYIKSKIYFFLENNLPFLIKFYEKINLVRKD